MHRYIYIYLCSFFETVFQKPISRRPSMSQEQLEAVCGIHPDARGNAIGAKHQNRDGGRQRSGAGCGGCSKGLSQEARWVEMS